MWRTIKQTNRETKTYKHKEEQGKVILYKRNEEIETKRVKLGFLGLYACAYTKHACAFIKHACATQLYPYTCKKHANGYTPQNPNTKKQERSNLEMKN